MNNPKFEYLALKKINNFNQMIVCDCSKDAFEWFTYFYLFSKKVERKSHLSLSLLKKHYTI